MAAELMLRYHLRSATYLTRGALIPQEDPQSLSQWSEVLSLKPRGARYAWRPLAVPTFLTVRASTTPVFAGERVLGG